MDARHFEALVRRFAETEWKKPVLVLLEGDLGVGKTTFVKELFESWGYAPAKVQSPTFLKLLEHEIPGQGLCLHLDCYRIDDIEDFDRLALESYLDASFVFVEWPELFLKYLDARPALAQLLGFKTRVRIGIVLCENGSRKIDVEALS